ncbi:hypothetical protein THAOC_06535, partial [Thalassiosira oceanica]
EEQPCSQHQQVVIQLYPVLAVEPRQQGLLLVGCALAYPPRRLLYRGQALEGGLVPGAERLARGPDLATFTGPKNIARWPRTSMLARADSTVVENLRRLAAPRAHSMPWCCRRVLLPVCSLGSQLGRKAPVAQVALPPE